MGDSFTKGAYEVIYKHPKWKDEATKYEEHLAAKLFHMSYTKQAVKTAMGKISRILTAYYGDGERKPDIQEQQNAEAAESLTDFAQIFNGEDTDVKVNKTLVEALMQGRRDNTGAGQVRKVQAGDERGDGTQFTQEQADEVNKRKLDEIINGDGNLREQMTLLYNGMFINGGHSKEQIAQGTSFKGVMQGITREKGMNTLSPDLWGINYDLLEGQSRYQKGEDVFDTMSMAMDLVRRDEELQNKGNKFTRWWRGLKRIWSASVKNHFLRKKREEPLVEGEKGLGLKHYEELGISPSKRERDFAVLRDKDGTERLQWKEGAAYFKIDKEVTAEGMLQTAGASGTTLRMLGAYRLMGASQRELLDFRLALIAWMVSSHDHSLYEILKGSHNAGVRGTESLEEAAVMYTNIDPLDTETLRENFAQDKQFPHEIIYKMELNELKQAREANEERIGRDEERADKLLEKDTLTEQSQIMKKLLDASKTELAKKKKRTLQLLDRLLGDPTKKFKNDKDGSERRQVEEELMSLQKEIYFLENDTERLAAKNKEVNEKKQKAEVLPELTLFANSGVTKGTDAMAMRAQDLALNIYTTGAYMTMNVGSKWGGMLGKLKLKDKRVDEKKFGSYQSSYKAETKNGALLDQIYDMTRASARMAQDALEERGAREVDKDSKEADYLHAAKVNTFRGEKHSGGGYQTVGQEYDTRALTSTSKRMEKALMYFGKSVEQVGYDNSVLALYELNGKGAVDITQLSKVANEEEVLIPSGTRFRVEKTLVKNVSVETLKKGPDNLTPDAVSDEAVAQEFALNEDGKVNYGGIKHVNVVKLVEVDGPGARRRREAEKTKWKRMEILESLAQMQ